MNFMIPKPPSFRSMAAKNTDPIVEASTWASGNHKWKGKTGIFIKKLKINKGHKNICFLKIRFGLIKAIIPELPTSKINIIIPKSIKKDPNKV